jgi:hypothetical protein
MTRILLTGGLGNQLFQLSAGIYYAKDENLVLDSRFGNPRCNSQGIPDICELIFPQGVSLLNSEPNSIFLKRMVNFCLRRGAQKVKRDLEIIALEVTTSILLSASDRKLCIARIACGIGFDLQRVRLHKYAFLIGYFQSDVYLNFGSTREKFEKSLAGIRFDLENMHPQKSDLESVMIHMRFGDYKNEKSFGIPGLDYYQNAISNLNELSNLYNISVYSDEPELAELKLIELGLPSYKIINFPDETPAHTIVRMSSHQNFIIANSTFSWWACQLSQNQNKVVICPQPWFRSGLNPRRLIPDSWIQLPGNYDSR